jgi:hypothetical protein
MKTEKGQAVFGDNIDEILAEKIIGHSKNNIKEIKEKPRPADTFFKKAPDATRNFVYHTPEEKRRNATAKYGIFALVCLALLGVMTFFLLHNKKG